MSAARNVADPAFKYLVSTTLPLAKASGASKELIQSLEHAIELASLRLKFQVDTTSEESAISKKLSQDTMSNDWPKVHAEGKTTWNCNPVMLCGLQESQFLKSFVSAHRAKDILEVGMFTGYSALNMAEGLPADGKIVTIDRDEYLKTFFLSHIQDSPHKEKVEVIIGQAIDVMKDLQKKGNSFDVVFLDASKDEYSDYLKLCMEGNLLRPNGTILIDNAFQGQKAYTDSQSVAAKFAQLIKDDPKLHVTLLPMQDGIFMIRRQTDVNNSTS